MHNRWVVYTRRYVVGVVENFREGEESAPVGGRAPALFLAESIEKHRCGHEDGEEEDTDPETHLLPSLDFQISQHWHSH